MNIVSLSLSGGPKLDIMTRRSEASAVGPNVKRKDRVTCGAARMQSTRAQTMSNHDICNLC